MSDIGPPKPSNEPSESSLEGAKTVGVDEPSPNALKPALIPRPVPPPRASSSAPNVRPPPRPKAESVMELDADDLLVEDASPVSVDETEEIGSAELLRVENAATALAIHEAANASIEPPGAVVVAPIVDLSASAPAAPADPMGPTVAAFAEPAATPVVPAVEPLGATMAAPDPIGPTVAVFPEAPTSPTLLSADASSPPRPEPPRPEPPRPDAFREKSEHATLLGVGAAGAAGLGAAAAKTPSAGPVAGEAPVGVGGVDVLASTTPAHASASAPAQASAPPPSPPAVAVAESSASASEAPVSEALPVRAPWLALKDRRVVIALVAALALLCVGGFVIASAARTDAVASVDGPPRAPGPEPQAAHAPPAREREDDVPPPAQVEDPGATAAATESPTTTVEPSVPSPELAEANAETEANAAAAEKPSAPSPLDETPAPDVGTHARSETKARSTQARRTKTSATPPPLPSPAPAAPAPVSSVGIVRVNDGLSVIQVDGRYVRVQGGAVSVACGTHKIKAGMGNARVVVVPCGGTVSL